MIIHGVIAVLAGIVTFVWPGITALALVYLIAFWALFTGFVELIDAYRLRNEIDNEWLVGIMGLLRVVFGAILVIAPGSGALAITWLIGWFAILDGVLHLALAWRLRKIARTRRSSPSGEAGTGMTVPDRIEVVVVPSDGSFFSRRGILAGAVLAARLGAEVELLSTVDKQDDIPEREAELDQLEQWLANQKRRFEDIEWVAPAKRRMVTDRDPAGEIHEELRRLGNAMVCMASHGRGRSAVIAGSVATRSSCAVTTRWFSPATSSRSGRP